MLNVDFTSQSQKAVCGKNCLFVNGLQQLNIIIVNGSSLARCNTPVIIKSSLLIIFGIYWHCLRSMWSRVYATVGRLSVTLQ